MKPIASFYISLTDPIPPSVNAMYTTFRGKRVLKKEGVSFKAALTRLVASECAAQPWQTVIDAVYTERAWVRCYIAFTWDWLNASWKPGRKTEKGELKSPYKKKDASNYVKVIEDAVVAGTGIDDAAHFDSRIFKHVGEPLIEVVYEVFPWPPNS